MAVVVDVGGPAGCGGVGVLGGGVGGQVVQEVAGGVPVAAGQGDVERGAGGVVRRVVGAIPPTSDASLWADKVCDLEPWSTVGGIWPRFAARDGTRPH